MAMPSPIVDDVIEGLTNLGRYNIDNMAVLYPVEKFNAKQKELIEVILLVLSGRTPCKSSKFIVELRLEEGYIAIRNIDQRNQSEVGKLIKSESGLSWQHIEGNHRFGGTLLICVDRRYGTPDWDDNISYELVVPANQNFLARHH